MLGTDLVEVLSHSHQVVGAGRSPANHLKTSYHICDFTNPLKVSALLKAEKPEIVFHAAALTKVDDCEKLPKHEVYRQNKTATENIANVCSEIGAKIVLFSTDYVFNGNKSTPYLETDLRDPQSVYGESKMAAEEYLEKNNSNFIIFRLSWLYGIHGHSFPGAILKLAKNNSILPVVSDQRGAPTWTKDLAKWLRITLEKSKISWELKSQRIYHLANSGHCTWADFARLILQTAGTHNVSIKEISSEELGRPAKRPRNSVFDLSKIETDWGLSLRGWKDAYQEFYEELRKFEI